MSYVKKYALMNRHLDVGSISVLARNELLTLIEAGKLVQTNEPDRIFHKPSGQVYVGPGRGKGGGSYVDSFWWQTYEGLKHIALDDDELIVRVYDGDPMYGRARGLRGEWHFKAVDFDWWTLSFLRESCDRSWDLFVIRAYEAEQEAKYNEALQQLSSRLLA